MIPCVVIRDLLLLHEAGECSEETARIIEEHLETCQECRQAQKQLSEPLVIEMDEESSGEIREKDISLKKTFQKIKRRWIASILIVLLIFPLYFTGRLIHNEIEKDGVCFSNLDDLYRCNKFMKAVQKGDYEKAFSYFNVEATYENLINGYKQTAVVPLHKVDIDDEVWYVDKSLYLNEYQTYSKTGDSREFWRSILISNMEHNGRTPIPKELMTEQFLKDLENEEIVAFSEGETIRVGADTYYLWKDSADREFYVINEKTDAPLGERNSLDYSFVEDARCSSKRNYEEWMGEQRKQQEELDEYVKTYKAMGLKTYVEHEKKYFIENMEQFKKEGFRIKSFHIRPYYYYGEKEREWTFAVVVELYKDNQLFGVTTGTTGEKNRYSKDFEIDSSSGGLRIDSSWLGKRGDNDFNRAINYLGLAEDVDNYFGY